MRKGLNKRAIIFDFDGTIADSFSVALNVAREFTGHRLDREDVSRLRGMTMLQALHELRIPLWQACILAGRVRRRIGQYADEVTLVPDVDRAIVKLAESYELFVLSANSSTTVRAVLARYGVDKFFTDIHGGVLPWRKARALRRLARAYGLAPGDTWYVGDSGQDIKEAHQAKMRAVAVSWGYSNIHVLTQQQPEALVFNSDELLTWFLGERAKII